MVSIVLAPRWKPRRERLFFSGAAGALLLVTFAGFAQTYYLAPMFAAPALTPLVHLHGVVFTAWMFFFMGQTSLVAARRVDLHRTSGMIGAVLATAIVVLGIVVAIESGRRGGGGPLRNQPVFLMFPLANILMFGGLCAAGVVMRQQAGYHKRLMLLATVALATTPLARIWRMTELPLPLPVGGMILSDVFVAALAVFDFRTRGQLHPVTLWVGGFFVVTQPLRVLASRTEAWQGFARGLLG
ncbi:hypothetical protein GCM10011529_00500 [Polymorphobacter glacialis]|uniref:DUF2306 domain-containing protein n=1 Tax=Sandarakinorhabdus glacialis TaxID=1614636 RepID=A0A917E3N1_9SPHN|nr:hypothetical protein [Polymorphobacter glacialis]GGD98365.1 hypothetical protein GCM10011529_00500 [Polymorphobacter glacialis]